MTGASLIYLVLVALLADALPRSRSKLKNAGPQLVYDQKQTGDYNIQLHLKDFQIIALLGDDALGDYDYNYDYTDFTIKPSASKPTSTSTTTTNLPSIISSTSTESIPATIKPSLNLTQSNSSTTATNLNTNPIEFAVYEPFKEKTTEKSNKDEEVPLTTLNNEIISSNSPFTSTVSSSESSSTTSTTEHITPDKIKVQILDAAIPTVEAPTGPVGIIPGEDVQSEINAEILQGELASYRRCASGFARDKKGRCRKIRRPGVAPQLPFGFSRIASNLATRLRLPTGDKSEGSIAKSAEN